MVSESNEEPEQEPGSQTGFGMALCFDVFFGGIFSMLIDVFLFLTSICKMFYCIFFV